jgi:uncharacterized protein (DUF2236 family)
MVCVSDVSAIGAPHPAFLVLRRTSSSERDRCFAEGVRVARLYGAVGVPTSEAELEMLLHAMAGRLERSDILFEFSRSCARRLFCRCR